MGLSADSLEAARKQHFSVVNVKRAEFFAVTVSRVSVPVSLLAHRCLWERTERSLSVIRRVPHNHTHTLVDARRQKQKISYAGFPYPEVWADLFIFIEGFKPKRASAPVAPQYERKSSFCTLILLNVKVRSISPVRLISRLAAALTVFFYFFFTSVLKVTTTL